ncbi:DUF4913 domain-containing protein [Nocardia tengchongensis]|uniref:DUF4913 domain-containing protein n=1 Tax=Nocardia tengchongensis TaxID=2055889 RepID=UPI0036C2E07E
MTDNGTPTIEAENSDQAAAAAQVVPDMDLGKLAEDAVRRAVVAQFNAQAKEIAEGVVAKMLTPEVIAGMRQTAIDEAQLALNPAPEPEPEPEPEPAQEAEEEAAEPPRQKKYPTLKAFVEDYVVHIYRREVSVMGSEKTRRWCPCWWDHGEAISRLKDMWAAFEHLRLGETVEPASWWLVYFDPMMERLFDPEGPFKYCSPAGHTREMQALPVTPADPRLFPENEEDDEESFTPPVIVVPRAPVGNRRQIPGSWEFPG